MMSSYEAETYGATIRLLKPVRADADLSDADASAEAVLETSEAFYAGCSTG